MQKSKSDHSLAVNKLPSYAVFSAITLAVTYIIAGVLEPQAGCTPADFPFHRKCVHGKTL